MKALGHVFKYGDNVDTDVIIPARYLNATKGEELAKHCMEDIDRNFVKKVQKGGDTIRLNAMSAVSLLSGIIKKFREEEPDAAFVVTDQKESMDWHLCILSAGPGMSYQGGQELLSEEVFLGTSSSSWLGEKDETSLRDVENENFILLPRGTVLRNLADTRFREHHLSQSFLWNATVPIW